MGKRKQSKEQRGICTLREKRKVALIWRTAVNKAMVKLTNDCNYSALTDTGIVRCESKNKLKALLYKAGMSALPGGW